MPRRNAGVMLVTAVMTATALAACAAPSPSPEPDANPSGTLTVAHWDFLSPAYGEQMQ